MSKHVILDKKINRVFRRRHFNRKTIRPSVRKPLNQPENLFYSTGQVKKIDDKICLLDKGSTGGKSRVQDGGRALVGDGAGYGTFAEPIVLRGDFEGLSVNFTAEDRAVYQALLGGNSTDECLLRVSNVEQVQLWFGGTALTFDLLPLLLGGAENTLTLSRVGADVTATINDVSQTKTFNTSDITIRYVGKYLVASSNLWYDNIWDLTINGTQWPMINVGEDYEYPTVGDNYITWSGFSGDPVQEFTDGTGTNFHNESGYSEYENLFLRSEPESTADFDVTGGSGYSFTDASGDLTSYVSKVLRFDTITSVAYMYMSLPNAALNTRYFSVYVEMDDGSMPIVTGSNVDPNTDLIMHVNGTNTPEGNVTVENVSGAVYKVSVAVAANNNANVGVLRYPANSDKGMSISRLMLSENDSPYVETFGAPVTGIQPAGFQSPRIAGPLDYTKGCLEADGSGYFDTGLTAEELAGGFTIEMDYYPEALSLSTGLRLFGGSGSANGVWTTGATSWGYIKTSETAGYFRVRDTDFAIGSKNSLKFSAINTNGNTVYFVSLNGVTKLSGEEAQGSLPMTDLLWVMARDVAIQASGRVSNIKVWNASGTLLRHYPCENGHPTEAPLIDQVQDLVTGTWQDFEGFTGEAYGWLPIEGSYAMQYGYEPGFVDGTELVSGSNWEAYGSGGTTFTDTDGELSVTRDGSNLGHPYQEITTIPDKVYEITLSVTSVSSAAFAVGTSAYGRDIIGTTALVTGSHTLSFKASGSSTYLDIWNLADSNTITVDNISVKEADNLVENGEFSSDRAWTKGDGISISGGSLNFDGTQTALTQAESTGFTPVVGRSYIITTDITITAGSYSPRLGGVTGDSTTVPGVIVSVVQAVSTETIILRGNAECIASINSITVTESPAFTLADSDSLLPDGTAPTYPQYSYLPTENGKVAPHQKLGGFPCVEGDGTGYYDTGVEPSTAGKIRVVGFWGNSLTPIAGAHHTVQNARCYIQCSAIGTFFIATGLGGLSLVTGASTGDMFDLTYEWDGTNQSASEARTGTSATNTYTGTTPTEITLGILATITEVGGTTGGHKIMSLELYDSSDNLVNRWVASNPGSTPEILQDVVGGQHAIGQSIATTLYTTTDEASEVPHALAKGFSEDWTPTVKIGPELWENPTVEYQDAGDFTTFADGTCRIVATDGNAEIRLTGGIKASTYYDLTLTNINSVDGFPKLTSISEVDGNSQAEKTIQFDGTYRILTGPSADYIRFIRNSYPTDVTFEVSVKEVLGYVGPELITNGTFDEDLTGWTSGNSASLSVDENQRLVVTNTTTSYGYAYRNFRTKIGRTYRLSVDYHYLGSPGLIRVGIAQGTNEHVSKTSMTSDQTYETTFVATTDTTWIRVGNANNDTSDEAVSFDNVSVREDFELVVNGGFNTDTDWTLGTGFSISDGVCVGTGSATSVLQENVLEEGKKYLVTFDIVSVTAGYLRPRVGGNIYGTIVSTTGTFTEVLDNTGGSNSDQFAMYGTIEGTFDNVSVVEYHEGIYLAEDTGLMEDGTAPDYRPNSMEALDNLPGLTEFPTGQQMQLHYGDALANTIEGRDIINAELTEFNGGKSRAVYSEAQSIHAENVALRCGCVAGQLVTNGDFSDATGWVTPSTWVIINGVAQMTETSAGNNALRREDQTVVDGEDYLHIYDLISCSAVSFRSYLGGSQGNFASTPGTYAEVMQGGASNEYIGVASTAAGTLGSVDNVSVRKLERQY